MCYKQPNCCVFSLTERLCEGLTVGMGSSLEKPWLTAEEVTEGKMSSSSGITDVMVCGGEEREEGIRVR